VALVPGVARADGDPASDVLATQAAFVPWDAGASTGQQAQLAALARAASRAGYPVRVALIASPRDLGSVTPLWHRPQAYARFLATELSLVYRGRVLVLMPGAAGLAGSGQLSAGERAALRAPARDGLVPAATAAVRRLAAAAGHPVAAPPTTARAARVAARSGDAVAWAVLASGAALIALACTASLRARPLRLTARSS
jgi:hypothetical protein